MNLLVDFIYVTGIVILLIILFSLSKNRQKELPQKVLIILFVMMLFTLLNFYAYLHRIKWLHTATLSFSDPIEWLIGPLLLVYIKSLFSNNKDLVKRNLIHFTPYFVYTFFISIPFAISQALNSPAFKYFEWISDNEFFESLLFTIQAPYLLLYSFLSLRLLNRYNRSLKQNFSNLLEKDLTWVKYLLIGIIITISVDFATTIYEHIYGQLGWDTGILTVIILVLVVIFLGYYGSSQSQILLPDFIFKESVDPILQLEKSEKTHHLTNASDSEIEMLKKKLNEVLENEKPYLNEDLTLGGLAELLPTTDKKLSTLLNKYIGKTFYDLINTCRIEEFKKRLENPTFENYTLIAIAYDSGFKSKTSFNRIFKKLEGCSPSQYKSNLINKSEVENPT